MPRGGVRPGSGRKKGTIGRHPVPASAREALRAELERRIIGEASPIIAAVVRGAIGATTMVVKRDGQWVRARSEAQVMGALAAGSEAYIIQTADPEPRILINALDRILGKPTEHTEISGAIAITWEP